MANMQDPSCSSEKMIAEELSKLSLQDREKAYEDVHGVRNLVEESQQLIEKSLLDMEQELKSVDNRFAYDEAERVSKDYVSCRKLRLMFLRATLFDPKKAASRLVDFFNFKLELFGAEKLVKNITYEDLGEDGMEAMKEGAQQILPSRDSQGRAVVISNQSLFLSLIDRFKDPLLTLKRSFWYTMVSIADDEETQKRGLVFIAYAAESQQFPDAMRRELLKWCGMMGAVVPARAAAIHYVHGSSDTAPLLQAIVLGVGTVLRVRMRRHYGSHSECQYSLVTYGIPITDFPLTPSGEVKLTNHTKRLERQQNKEHFLKTNNAKDGAVDLPSRSDVLLGRGKPFNSYPGNRHLHEIVANFYDRYNTMLRRAEKTKLGEEIVNMVHRYGGHFLKQDEESGMWVEVSNLEARNKVAHGFRRKREFALKATSKLATSAVAQKGETDEGSSKRMRVLLEPGQETASCNTFFCRQYFPVC